MDKNIKTILKDAIVALLAALLSYSCLERIKGTPLLRFLFIILIIALHLLIILSLCKYIFGKTIPIYSKYYPHLWGAWFLVCLFCLIAGIFCEVVDKPKIHITTKVYEQLPNDEADTNDDSQSESDKFIQEDINDTSAAADIDTQYYKAIRRDDSYSPIFIDVRNDTDDIIVMNDYDAFAIKIIEYIPLEELSVIPGLVQYSKVFEEPVYFRMNITTEKSKLYANPIIDGEEKELTGAMIKIAPNDIMRFIIDIYPEEKGLYQFSIICNYSRNGKPCNYETNEFVYMCGERSNYFVSKADNGQQ